MISIYFNVFCTCFALILQSLQSAQCRGESKRSTVSDWHWALSGRVPREALTIVAQFERWPTFMHSIFLRLIYTSLMDVQSVGGIEGNVKRKSCHLGISVWSNGLVGSQIAWHVAYSSSSQHGGCWCRCPRLLQNILDVLSDMLRCPKLTALVVATAKMHSTEPHSQWILGFKKYSGTLLQAGPSVSARSWHRLFFQMEFEIRWEFCLEGNKPCQSPRQLSVPGCAVENAVGRAASPHHSFCSMKKIDEFPFKAFRAFKFCEKSCISLNVAGSLWIFPVFHLGQGLPLLVIFRRFAHEESKTLKTPEDAWRRMKIPWEYSWSMKSWLFSQIAKFAKREAASFGRTASKPCSNVSSRLVLRKSQWLSCFCWSCAKTQVALTRPRYCVARCCKFITRLCCSVSWSELLETPDIFTQRQHPDLVRGSYSGEHPSLRSIRPFCADAETGHARSCKVADSIGRQDTKGHCGRNIKKHEETGFWCFCQFSKSPISRDRDQRKVHELLAKIACMRRFPRQLANFVNRLVAWKSLSFDVIAVIALKDLLWLFEWFLCVILKAIRL